MQNNTLKNDYGHMTVMTTGVVARKKFVTVVLNAGEVYDVEMSNTAEEATRIHQNFCTMCSVFAPLMEKVASKDKATHDEGMAELIELEACTRVPTDGYVH